MNCFRISVRVKRPCCAMAAPAGNTEYARQVCRICICNDFSLLTQFVAEVMATETLARWENRS